MDDRKLVDDFLRGGSEKAFIALYRAKTPHLYRMALRLSQDEDQAGELLQEMWITAIRRLGSFEWRSTLKTWLTGILINIHRSKTRKTMETINDEQLEQTEFYETAQSLATVADLEAAISSLPPGYREILILHDVEGYKHRDIAEMLGIGEGTSKSQLFYARKRIRQFLNEEYIKH